MNRGNLEKLATYLESGELAAKFDMSTYCDISPNESQMVTCGSIGCAIGHGPYAGISKLESEDFTEYSYRVFEIHCNRLWSFLFSPFWDSVDNTPEGVVKRIRWALQQELPIPNSSYNTYFLEHYPGIHPERIIY